MTVPGHQASLFSRWPLKDIKSISQKILFSISNPVLKMFHYKTFLLIPLMLKAGSAGSAMSTVTSSLELFLDQGGKNLLASPRFSVYNDRQANFMPGVPFYCGM